jgi:hypothetical protein
MDTNDEHIAKKEIESTSIACRSNRDSTSLFWQSELKSKLREALILSKPEIGKEYLYDRCVNKYVDAMLPAISTAMSANYRSDAQFADQFSFHQSQMRERIGTIGKQQQYIYQLMQSDVSTCLLVVLRKGFSKNGVSKLSAVRLNPIYRELVMEELLNLHIEANQTLLLEIERTANYWVSADPSSLASFIAKTTATLRATNNGVAYKEKLLRNLTAAKQLATMIHPADDTHSTSYLNERWVMADCGRIYGQGYSLQRMPKEVRHAALGVCHKYDFKTSAFALMAGLAHAIDPTLKLGAILDYIRHRQKIRQRIASQLNIDESLVKTIFTSLGFGAELKNNLYNSIRGALARAARQQLDPAVRLERDIYNNLGADEFHRLVANPTFRYIYDELQQINATIINHYKTCSITIGDLTYKPIDPKTGKRRTDKQKLAWIYQALESQAMRQFADLAEQEPLLTTHDCIYFKHKLPASVAVDATYQLQHRYPYLRFEHEAIYPIAEDKYHAARFSAAEQYEREHKEFIAAETKRAALYSCRLTGVQQHVAC